MVKAQIGEHAGLLWHLLDNNKLWDINDLKKASGLTDPQFYAALGWLARENKVDFGMNGDHGGDTVSLMVSIYY